MQFSFLYELIKIKNNVHTSSKLCHVFLRAPLKTHFQNIFFKLIQYSINQCTSEKKSSPENGFPENNILTDRFQT